jgi:hypothetical protein
MLAKFDPSIKYKESDGAIFIRGTLKKYVQIRLLSLPDSRM